MCPTKREIIAEMRNPDLLLKVVDVERTQLTKLAQEGEDRKKTEPANLNDFLMDLLGGDMAKELRQFFGRMDDAQARLRRLAKRLKPPLKEQAARGIEMFQPEIELRLPGEVNITLSLSRGAFELCSNFHPKEGVIKGKNTIGKNERIMWSLKMQKSGLITLDGLREELLMGITRYKDTALKGLNLVSEAMEGRGCPENQ